MGKVIDETGNRYGRLVVVKEAYKDKRHTMRWLCCCDCGNEVIVGGSSLRRGDTRSCGCLNREVSKSKVIDLTGMRFNFLTVLKRSKNKGGHVHWLCRCDCGNETIVSSGGLKRGTTKSCGCYQRKVKSQFRSKSLVGRRFGMLEVLERKRSNGTTYYLCRCDCSNEKWISSSSLKGGTTSCGCKKFRRGIDSPNWKPNLNDIDRLDRRTDALYVEWSQAVMQRDDYTCVLCGERNCKHASHHLEGWTTNEALRYEVSNGITLCEEDHTLFHMEYGYGNNTRAQFEEFKLRYSYGESLVA